MKQIVNTLDPRLLQYQLSMSLIPLLHVAQAEMQKCTVLYLCVGRLGDFLQVILRPSRDLSKEDLFGHASPQHHTHPVKELLTGVQVLLFGQILCIA